MTPCSVNLDKGSGANAWEMSISTLKTFLVSKICGNFIDVVNISFTNRAIGGRLVYTRDLKEM